MVLGCGPGFAGESSEFAAGAVQEVLFPHRCTINRFDISPATLCADTDGLFDNHCANRGRTYDLIVSHSLAHFIPDLDSFFMLLRRLSKPSGALVLGHEPNAQFWKNEKCQRALAEFQEQRAKQPWWKRLRANPIVGRFARRENIQSIVDKTNHILMRCHGFTAPLSANEINRLVDVHRPEAIPGDFRIGFEGFDVDYLTRNYLPGFTLAWAGTSAHLGYIPAASLSPEWSRREAVLADELPMAGSVLNAYWRKA